MIPEFIAEMYLVDDDFYIIGSFHLGQVYNLRMFVVEEKMSAVYACQEQIDEDNDVY